MVRMNGTGLELERHLDALREAGRRLADVAVRADLDAPIPTCPGWRMRDLLRHMGDVHRWANAHVAERRIEPIRDAAGVAAVAGPIPEDARLVEWFRDGHARLVETLETADPDVRCWFLLAAPSPLPGWARRQAHETTIHRADAESASGPPSSVATDFAVDGIDELLYGFLARNDPPEQDLRTVRVTATDMGRDWSLRIGSDGVDAVAGTIDADTHVRGLASELYFFLWNRLDASSMTVTGDPTPLAIWREAVKITWGRPR